jgi:hypothetical protein
VDDEAPDSRYISRYVGVWVMTVDPMTPLLASVAVIVQVPGVTEAV